MRTALSIPLIALAVTVGSLSDLGQAADPPGVRPGSKRPVKILAVMIGGMDSDPTPAQIDGTAARIEGNSGLYRLARDLKQELVIPEYFNWNGTRAGQLKTPHPPRSAAIAAVVRDHAQEFPTDRIAIVGNSWGGLTALEVAQDLYRHETPTAVNLVVFLDAASTGRAPARPAALPPNLNQTVHFFTRNVFVWGRLPDVKRLENIDLGDPDTGFMQNGRPAYNAPFNFQAHVAAEWDESIHANIRQRLLALIADPVGPAGK